MPRPRSPLLSLDAIVQAAITLVDESGDFSFPKVARRIGVSQSALYNHIANREHIVELMRGRLFADQVLPTVDDLSWEDAVRVLVRAYRDAFAAHPRLVPLLVSQTVRDRGVMNLYEGIAAALDRAGLRQADVGPAIAVIDYLALGAALELTAPQHPWAPTAGDFPALSRAVLDAGSVVERAESAFSFGLDVLVEGLRAKALRNK